MSPGKTFKNFLKKEEAKSALDFWHTEFGSSEELHKKLDESQIEEAKKGNIVICGKLSIYFLKDLATHKIWLEAPIEIRAARTANRDKINFPEALKQIREREKLERENWKRIYGFDDFELKNECGLVLDTSNLTLEESVDRIVKFIKGI